MDIQGPHNLTLPVHEIITAGSLYEVGLLKGDDSYYADYQYIHGVLWNDDPGNHFYYCDGRIKRHLVSGLWWITKFKSYGWLTKIKSNIYCHADAPLMARSHYGDMQFLHSMKSYSHNNKQTYDYILAWAEFCYRVSIKDIPESMRLSAVDIPLIVQLFPADSRHGKKPIYDLFKAKNCRPATPKRAIGSLLHMIQDSFSHLHAKRVSNSDGSKGAVIEFYNLIEQLDIKHIHVEAEAFPHKFSATQHPVRCYHELIQKIEGGMQAKTVGAKILQFMLNGEAWQPRVRAFLMDEIFNLSNTANNS